MESFPNYLFLLIANLSQQRDKDKITRLFIDGLNSLLPEAAFSWKKENDAENSIIVCTRKNNFGNISYNGKLKEAEKLLPLLQNAVQMLAVILERLKQEQALQNSKLQLEDLVEQRTIELKEQNREYEALNEEYLSQNEKLIVTNNQLYESEERFRLAMQATNDGLWDYLVPTNELYFSPGWKRMLGYADHELKNEFATWKRLTNPEDIKTAWKVQNEYLEGKRDRFELELRMKHKNGSIVNVLCRANGYFDKNGKLNRVVGTNIDITARKQQEKALQKEKGKAQNYLDIAGVMLLSLDKEGNITLVNQKGCEILGYNHDELIGKNWFENFLPEKVKTEVKLIFDKLIHGEVEPVEYVENLVLNKKGEQRYIAWHNTLLKDENGSIIGTLDSGEDITEKKLAEIELIESEKRYRTIIESANDAIFIGDKDTGIIVDVNKKAEELIGLPRSKIIGKHQSQLHPEEYKEYNRFKFIALNKKVANLNETRVLHSSGKKIPVEISPTKIKLKDNREYIVGFFRDISKRKHTEEKLIVAKNKIQESEERLRFLFENMIQGVVYHSSTGEVIYANKAAAEILGLTIEQLQGKTSMDPRWHSIHEDGSAYPGEQHPALMTLKTGEPVRNSKMGVFNPDDNAYRWININSLPKFKDNETKPYQVVVTFEDITEIINTKKQLLEVIEKAEENEKQFRQLFENMDQGFALHKMVYDGKGKPVDYRFVLMNKSFEKLTGIKAADFIGRTAKEMLPQIEQVWIDNYGKVARGGKPLHFENYAQDLKKHYDVVAYSPRKDYFATVFTDVTEKKGHEQELEKHRNHLEMLVKERTDELEASNEELKATNEELINQKEALERTLKKLNHAQAQLIQSEKMASLGVLVAGVAHEINNPVNFINSSLTGLKNNLDFLAAYAELYSQLSEKNDSILKEIVKKEKENSLSQMLEMFKRSVEIIEVGVERTTRIVKGLKSFARADEKELTQYNVHENIDNTLLILYNQYKNRIEIIKKYNKIPIIRCYPGQINQVLMNILTNAIQAIRNKGEITIITEQIEEDKISIKINDTGTGIPENIIDKIFDPFFTTKEIGKGTGLGLAISYGIIDEHKGRIFVESNEGKGSSFTIILPVNKIKEKKNIH